MNLTIKSIVRLHEKVSPHTHTHLVPLYLERLVSNDGTAKLEIVALANPEEPLRVALHVRRNTATPSE